MTEEQLLKRIVINPRVMVGKPVIKGTRVPVAMIVHAMGNGASEEELLDDYQGITKEDILACLLYAARNMDVTDVVPIAVEGV